MMTPIVERLIQIFITKKDAASAKVSHSL